MSMFLKKAPDGTTSFRLIINQDRGYLNSCFLLKTAATLDKGWNSLYRELAEVVGSTPTQFISFYEGIMVLF